jgi:hypothetical protein
MEGRLGRWLPVLVVTLALAVAGIAAGTGLTGGEAPRPGILEPGEPGTPAPAETVRPQPVSPPDEPGEFRSGNPALLAYLALFLGLVLLIAGYLAYHGARWLLHERIARRGLDSRTASQPDAAAEAAEVRQALRAGLADIDAGGDARRAIIACWLRLERVAAAAGSARLVADTPADLVDRLLARHLVSRPALERLAGAYRRARYAPAEVGDDLVLVARQALQEVDRQLSGPPVAEPVRR